jgi:hypothetical protein
LIPYKNSDKEDLEQIIAISGHSAKQIREVSSFE